MTRKSDKDLIRELGSLRLRVSYLSIDPTYGVNTRASLRFELPTVKSNAQYVVYMDIDNLHGLNEKYTKDGVDGHEIMDGKIKRALHIRCTDVLIRCRWYSGDEFAFVLSGNPEGFCARLNASLNKEGITATMAYVNVTHDIEADIKRAGAIVMNAKRQNCRGRVYASPTLSSAIPSLG